MGLSSRYINAAVIWLAFISLDLKTLQVMGEWPVATPQSQSMSADSLNAFDGSITSGRYGYID